ncbi:hypothetical protein RJ55_03951 [Drechmeria coniospora]|nr:hypothetical protein RJ55_03951 [Drechmeria coniospora]
MSTPQVLSRRANGTTSTSTEPASREKSAGSAIKSRSAKSKGPADRSGETKTANEGESTRRARPRVHDTGEKLIVRRLPPGMTEAEFVSILGVDWQLSKGKVDWFSYCPGKVSSDPSKPSRPSRAYLHLIQKDDILALSQVVRTATWEDANSTFNNPSLIGPPTLEFSPYKKIPGSKKRVDARQGTIDQDQEFMAFLEALANPIPLRASIDIEEADQAKEETKVTTTPLVEYLKEKKAKGKDGSGRNARSGAKSKKDDEAAKRKSREAKSDKAEKASHETVKILSKKAATVQATQASKNGAGQNAANNAAGAPKSRRAGIAAAARILQRDLGLSPGSAHRRARHDAVKTEADTAASPGKEGAVVTEPAPATDAAPTASHRPKSGQENPLAAKSQPGRKARGGKGGEKSKATEATVAAPAPTPILLKKRGDAEAAGAPGSNAESRSAHAPNGKATTAISTNSREGGSKPSTSNRKASAAVSSGATRAFVKNANAAQGVTEATLRQALEAFGPVSTVEVDKRKGFAYAEFTEHRALVKAISSNPVQVAQTSVLVLERKDKKPVAAAGGAAGTTTSDKAPSRGRRGRGGGNKATGQSTPTAAAAAAANSSTGG